MTPNLTRAQIIQYVKNQRAVNKHKRDCGEITDEEYKKVNLNLQLMYISAHSQYGISTHED